MERFFTWNRFLTAYAIEEINKGVSERLSHDYGEFYIFQEDIEPEKIRFSIACERGGKKYMYAFNIPLYGTAKFTLSENCCEIAGELANGLLNNISNDVYVDNFGMLF